jgi:hypothetical protein
MAALKSGVAKALDGLRNHFPNNPIEVAPTEVGGAFVIIEGVELGMPYRQSDTWVGFYLSDACPHDDTYPFYVRGDLSRADGAELKTPLHINQVFPPTASTLPARASVMVSRRQKNQSSFAHETPLLKLLTVIKWMLQQ